MLSLQKYNKRNGLQILRIFKIPLQSCRSVKPTASDAKFTYKV